MQFAQSSPPHLSVDNKVRQVMFQLLYALVPGTLAAIWFFGWGVLVNLLIASLVCVGSEYAVTRLRGRDARASISDGSALVTACLLALALPPLVPWWLTTIGSMFAIVVAKQLYGGLGFNMFNPAMVGYIVVMISFPREMTFWTPPMGVSDAWVPLTDTLRIIFMGTSADELDAITMATPIDTLKAQMSIERDIYTTQTSKQYGAIFSPLSGKGWDVINLAFLAGGIWLLRKKVADWRLPVAFLVTLAFVSNLFAAIDYSTYSSTLFHLLSGGTMLAAFFIITDPVSASTTPRGRLVYAAGIAILTYVIRTWGGYPDGIAFAVVIMNMAVPIIDYTLRPKTYGTQRK